MKQRLFWLCMTLFWIIWCVWIISYDYAFSCVVLFISSHILVCYLFTNVDVFQYSWVGLWIVVLHSMFLSWYFGIRHWYILAYLCMYLYWLGIFIIYVHFDKCKCTIWLGSKLIELDTSNRLSSSFWYCQRGRDWMHKLKTIKNALWHQLRGSVLIVSLGVLIASVYILLFYCILGIGLAYA